MAIDVIFKLTKFTTLNHNGEDTDATESGFIAFGAHTDAFDYLAPEDIKSMTPKRAFNLLGDNLQDEAQDNGGFVYMGDYITLPFPE